MTAENPAGDVKIVEVKPLSAGREAVGLAGAIFLIILLMGLVFSSHKKETGEAGTESFQIKDIYLKNQAPLMYRSLNGVSSDILDLRNDSGRWPTVDELKEEGLPPFASAFLPTGLRGYAWSLHEGQGYVDYFGYNARASSPEGQNSDPLKDSFMLRIIDLSGKSHPSLPASVSTDARFFIQIWHFPAVREYPGADPASLGWKWIVSSAQTK